MNVKTGIIKRENCLLKELLTIERPNLPIGQLLFKNRQPGKSVVRWLKTTFSMENGHFRRQPLTKYLSGPSKGFMDYF
jgi:hypothetical protein